MLYIDTRLQSLSYYRSSEFVINFDVRQSGVSIPAVLNSNLSYPSINVINLSTCQYCGQSPKQLSSTLYKVSYRGGP